MWVNSFIYALIPLVLLLLARMLFAPRGWIFAGGVLAILFALPANYENAVWGFQSQFYLLVLLGITYLGGTFSTDRTDRLWTAAQAAGVFGLLAMGGGFIAPTAAAAIAVVRLLRRRDAHTIATLTVAATLVVCGWLLLPQTGAADGILNARSAITFVEALLTLLAWPSNVPLLAVLIHVPWLLFAARLLTGQTGRPGGDMLVAIGGWALLQAAAIAFSRGASFTDISPRYFDILVIGLAVNAACVALLMRDHWRRPAVIFLGTAWFAAVGTGLWHFNSTGRVNTYIAANADLHARTLVVVRNYIQTGDESVLSRDAHVAHHFPSIATMKRLLDTPGLRESLPAEVRGDDRASVSGRFVAGTLASWPWVLGMGAFVFVAVGCVDLARTRDAPARPARPAPIPFIATASLLAIAAVALVALGMRPWDIDPWKRLARMLEESGEAASGFDIAGAAGGIFALPGTPAGRFFGTYLGGDAFTGEFKSTEFPIAGRFVIVAVTGYPAGSGNSLRLEVLGADDSLLSSQIFKGPAPGERIEAWTVAVSAPPGSHARLVLVDGSTDMRGWLGVATPRFSDKISSAHRLGIALGTVGAKNARRLPAVLMVAAVVLGIIGWVARRRCVAVH